VFVPEETGAPRGILMQAQGEHASSTAEIQMRNFLAVE